MSNFDEKPISKISLEGTKSKVSLNDLSSKAVLPVSVYVPGGAGNGFLAVWSEMFRDLITSRSLTWRLFVRDFSAKYRQSALGYVWAVLPPIVTVSLFLILKRAGAVNIGDTGIPYPAYVLFGMLVWSIFAGGTIASANSLMQSGALIAKINFPRETLILSAFGNVLFTLLIQAILVVAVFFWYGIGVSWTIVFLPFLLFFYILFVIGVGFVLSLIQAVFHDVGNFLGMVMGILMLTAPVVYPPPQSWPYSLLNDFNPLSIFIIAARDLTIGGRLSNPCIVVLMCFLSLVIFCSGWRIFRLCMAIATERLG